MQGLVIDPLEIPPGDSRWSGYEVAYGGHCLLFPGSMFRSDIFLENVSFDVS